MRCTFYGPCKNWLFECNFRLRRWNLRIASHQIALWRVADWASNDTELVWQWLNPRHYGSRAVSPYVDLGDD